MDKLIKNHPRLNILFIFMFLCLLRMMEAATSYCSMENTSLDPAKCRPYLEALMYNVTPLNPSIIKADEREVVQNTWVQNWFTLDMAELCKEASKGTQVIAGKTMKTQEVWCSIIESQIETNTPYTLYDALSDHTVPILNVEKFASGLDRFW